jgi:hypothetical protein
VKVLIEFLKKSEACAPALKWLETQPDVQTAWTNCERGGWLLWLLIKLGTDRKKIVKVACKCARLSLHLVKKGEERPRIAIETAEAWTRGEATLGGVKKAAASAYAAAYAAYAAYTSATATDSAAAAAYAAYAAAYAAYAADSAADSAASAYAADSAADSAASAYAYTTAQRQCANIVREAISFEEVQNLLETKINTNS